jgi:hypothetical protein
VSRRYQEPITVRVAEDDGQPVAFTWRSVTYPVRVIAAWRLRTLWWDPERTIERTYYRVCTPDQQVFELYRNDGAAGGGGWVLDVCQD